MSHALGAVHVTTQGPDRMIGVIAAVAVKCTQGLKSPTLPSAPLQHHKRSGTFSRTM